MRGLGGRFRDGAVHMLFEKIKERAPLLARRGTPKQDVERVDFAAKDVQFTLGATLLEGIAEANRIAQERVGGPDRGEEWWKRSAAGDRRPFEEAQRAGQWKLKRSLQAPP